MKVERPRICRSRRMPRPGPGSCYCSFHPRWRWTSGTRFRGRCEPTSTPRKAMSSASMNPKLPRDSVVGQCRGRVEMTGCETWRTRDGHLPACAGLRRPAAGVRVSERPGCRRSWAGRGGACGRSTTVGSPGRGSHLGRHARPHGRWVARKGRRAGQLPVRTTGRIHAGESAVDRIELPQA